MIHRETLLIGIVDCAGGIREALGHLDFILAQCEAANLPRPIDFELVRVARANLVKVLEPIDRCERMTDAELTQFRQELRRVQREAEDMLEDQLTLVAEY